MSKLIANAQFYYFRMRYRELVGTAETIVVMNRDIQDVDSSLADIGQRCNPRLVEKKSAHLSQMKSDVLDKGTLVLLL